MGVVDPGRGATPAGEAAGATERDWCMLKGEPDGSGGETIACRTRLRALRLGQQGVGHVGRAQAVLGRLPPL